MTSPRHILTYLALAGSGFATAWALKASSAAPSSREATEGDVHPASEASTPPALAGLSPRERRLIRIADAKPGAFRESFERAIAEGDTKAIYALASQWAASDIEGLLDYSVEFGVGGQSYNFFYQLLRGLMAKGPEYAMQATTRFGRDSVAGSMAWQIITDTAKDSPDQAFQFLLEHAETLTLDGQAQSREAALMLADRLSSHGPLSDAQQTVMQNLLRHVKHVDPAKAVAFWRRLPKANQAELLPSILPPRSVAADDPIRREIFEAAREHIQRSPFDEGLYIGSFARQFASQLAEEGVGESIAWINSIATGRTRHAAISHVLGASIDQDPNSSMAALEALPPGPLRTSMSARMATALFDADPAASFAWAAQLPNDNTGRQAWRSMASNLAQKSAAEAAAHVPSLPDHPGTAEFIQTVGAYYARNEPEAALGWAAGVGGERGEIAIDAVVHDWVRSDASSAVPQVESLPAGPARDHAYRSLVSELIHASGTDASAWLAGREGADRVLALEAIDQLMRENPNSSTLLSGIRSAMD